MKLFRHSTSCLVHLLLLAELLVHSSSHPTGARNLCGTLKAMAPHVKTLIDLSKGLHNLGNKELEIISLSENRLSSLPHIPHHAGYFNSVQMNESLSELLAFTQSFRLHVDWLETSQENLSLTSDSTKQASAQLGHLSQHLNSSLQQVNGELPQSPSPSPPSLPTPSNAYDVLRYSVEISERLKVFVRWAQRVLRHMERASLGCPRH